MSYVNKIKKGNTEYDIHDPRLPDASQASPKQVLTLGSGNVPEWGDTMKLYYYTVQLNDSENNSVCQLRKDFFALNTDRTYHVLNTNIQELASRLGLTIPTVVDDATASSALTTLVQALATADMTSQFNSLFMSFLLEANDTLRVNIYIGTDVCPCFTVGDIGILYLKSNGTFGDFSDLDLSSVRNITFYLMETNLTD